MVTSEGVSLCRSSVHRAPRHALSSTPRFATIIGRSSRVHAYVLAREAGFPQPQLLSHLLHARRVPTFPAYVERLQRVADLIGFPRDAIFLADEPERPPVEFTEIPHAVRP